LIVVRIDRLDELVFFHQSFVTKVSKCCCLNFAPKNMLYSFYIACNHAVRSIYCMNQWFSTWG